MNTFKTILISALTFFTLGWFTNHPFLFGVLLFFLNNFFWFYISLIGEGTSHNIFAEFVDMDATDMLIVSVMAGIVYPILLIFNVDYIRDTELDNIWQHFFKKNAPKITFQSPIKIETPTEE